MSTQTTGGTSINCVLEHLIATKPEKALIITDGFVEIPDPTYVKKTQTKIEVLIPADGSAKPLNQHTRWPIHCLPKTRLQPGRLQLNVLSSR